MDVQEKTLGKCEKAAAPCQPCEFCIPFGARVTIGSDGCASIAQGTSPPDGTYNQITVRGGCIVWASNTPPPVLAQTPCAPEPCAGGAAVANVTPNLTLYSAKQATVSLAAAETPQIALEASEPPSVQSGNLYTLDASGRPVVRVLARGENGISVSGKGTDTEPLVITGAAQAKTVTVRSENSAIEVKAGEDGTTLKHKAGHSDVIQGMRFDAYGHLTGYEPPTVTSRGLTSIVGDAFIRIDPIGDPALGARRVTFQPPESVDAATYTLGAYDVRISKGLIAEATRTIVFDKPGTYKLGDWGVSINEHGSITGALLDPQPKNTCNVIHLAGMNAFDNYKLPKFPREGDPDSWLTCRPTHILYFNLVDVKGTLVVDVFSQEYIPAAKTLRGAQPDENGNFFVYVDGIEYNFRAPTGKCFPMRKEFVPGDDGKAALASYSFVVTDVGPGLHSLELPLLYPQYKGESMMTLDCLQARLAMPSL